MSLNSFEFQCNFPATGCLIVCGDTDSQMIEDSGLCSTIRCGVNSCASGNHSFVGGGSNNTASGHFSSVLGGCCNTSSGCFSSAMGCELNACDDFTHYVNNLCACGGIYSSNLTNGCAVCVGANGQISQYQGTGGTVECLVAGQNIAITACNSIYTICCQSCSAYSPLFCEGGAGSAYRVNANNTTSACYSFATGYNNNVGGIFSSAFGANNIVYCQCSTASGYNNRVCAAFSHVRGISNRVGVGFGGCFQNILGGYNNCVGNGTNSCISTVIGGQNNWIEGCEGNIIANGQCSFINFSLLSNISNGCINCINNSNYGFIGGGCSNSAYCGCFNFIGNGWNNRTCITCNSAIVNGCINRACSCYSFIGSGYQNQLTSQYASYSSIVGGYQNQINQTLTENSYSFIGGGQGNLIYNSSGHSILGGRCVEINLGGGNCFIGGFGCGLTSLCAACTFYTNNLCSCGNIFSNNLQNECAVCVGANGQLLGFTGIGAAGVLCATADPTATIRTDANNASTGDYSFVLGCFNSASGYYSFITGNNNSDATQNNVVILGRSSFTAPDACTTYVGCLSVQNISCGCGVCVGANGILVPSSTDVFCSSGGICSTIRSGVNACANGECAGAFMAYTNASGKASIVLGINNVVNDNYSTIIKGTNNSSSGSGYNFIAADICALVSGRSNVVISNYYSNTNGNYNSIVGGNGLTVSGNYNSVIGGQAGSIGGNNNVRLAGNSGQINGSNHVSLSTKASFSTPMTGQYNNSVSAYYNNLSYNGCYNFSRGGRAFNSYGFSGTGANGTYINGTNSSIIVNDGSITCTLGNYNFIGISTTNTITAFDFSTNLLGWSGGYNCAAYTINGIVQNPIINCGANYSVNFASNSQAGGMYSVNLGQNNFTSGNNNIALSGGYNSSYGNFATYGGCCNTVPASLFGCNHFFFSGASNSGCNNFTGISGFNLTNTTACSFMTNQLIATNICGASSICADACGIISPVVSDIRIKNDVLPLNYGIDDLRLLNPVSYDWKDSVNGLGKRLGFIAQELVKIVPESVKEKNGSYMYDDKAILPILAKSIQQISTRIHNLNKNLDNVISKN